MYLLVISYLLYLYIFKHVSNRKEKAKTNSMLEKSCKIWRTSNLGPEREQTFVDTHSKIPPHCHIWTQKLSLELGFSPKRATKRKHMLEFAAYAISDSFVEQRHFRKCISILMYTYISIFTYIYISLSMYMYIYI